MTGRFKNKYLEWLNRRLEHSAVWPAAAFLFMWPMLGIIICILILFGQRPDSAIRAWTETSDWNLSQRIASQNIFYDEHYLCTVAAKTNPYGSAARTLSDREPAALCGKCL